MNFSKHYEIVVVGGGIAGVAAAIQAARCGKKTVLIEKSVCCGGLATSGLVYIYLPLCDGNGHQVTFGIAEELLLRSMKYGPGDIPADWKLGKNAGERHRFRNVFSPASFILALDEVLEDNGVELWFDSVVYGVRRNGEKLEAVNVCNKSGCGEISAECFIDATGDAELFRKCGVPCHDANNSLTVWALEFRRGETDPGTFGAELGDEIFVFPNNSGTGFCGINGRLVSEYMTASRKVLRERYANQKEDRHDRYPLFLPTMPQLRKIWSIDAVRELTGHDADEVFDDSIGMAGDWRKAGPIWEIPYRSLCAQSGPENLIAAGRITGATGDAWEITRVIPAAALTGQAAGMASALSLETQTPFKQLEIARLQQELRKSGVLLHRKELGL